jgi:hypothetical protein
MVELSWWNHQNCIREWHTQKTTKYSQSVRCLTLFTYEKHAVESTAGTAEKDFSDPLPILKHILKEIFEECYPPLPTRSQSAPGKYSTVSDEEALQAVETMLVKELRAELERRGCFTGGLKAVLQERLAEARGS